MDPDTAQKETQNPKTDNPLEANFLTWHYTYSLPEFAKNRLESLANTPKFFNAAALLKNLFTPYRRMSVSGKSQKYGVSGLFDKITFNLTSIFVGFSVRLVLILTWITASVFLVIFDLLAIVVWAVFPLLSFPKYLSERQKTFFEKDIKDPAAFADKLSKTTFFYILSKFFDDAFLESFHNLKSPESLGVNKSQTPAQMLHAIYKNWQPLKTYLDGKNIKEKDFAGLVTYLEKHLNVPRKTAVAPIGQMLAYGYTNTLDRFAQEIVSYRLPSEEKHELLVQIEKILGRPQNNNVLLVGEAGVGRHSTLEELSAAILRGQLLSISDKKIMLLDTIALASVGKDLLEAKQNFEAVFSEAKSAGNIIMAIDNIDHIASQAEGRIDLTEVLTAILTDNNLPIIGVTNPDDFNKYIRPNGNFLSLFERVDIPEASPEETQSILVGKTIESLAKGGVPVTFQAIAEIAQKSSRLMLDRKQPEKAIILLNDAIAEAKTSKASIVDINLVDRIISRQTKTPVGKIQESEAQKLKNLEEILHKRVIGQNEAIEAIAKAMRRARAEIESGSRPIGSFMFLGPTGVGKTETAKALAEAYFGSEERMVRLDMSEFQGTDALKRLIGDAENQTPGVLATKIRETPYTLLLVDEFEKATSGVHNLFLQILDEGFLTDAFGKKVSFDNVIIIATSNAGAEFIREEVAKSQIQNLSKKLVEFVLSKGLFTPELVNRFDGVIVYHPLTEDEAVKVTGLMLQKLARQLKDTKNITLQTNNLLTTKIAQAGFDPTLGARPIRRFIADHLEDAIAKMIIGGMVKNGDTIPPETLLKFVG